VEIVNSLTFVSHYHLCLLVITDLPECFHSMPWAIENAVAGHMSPTGC